MSDSTVAEAIARGRTLPPGPGGLGLGRLRHRMRDGVGFYESMHREYGEIVYFRVLSHKFCVLFDPAVFQEMFVTNSSSFELGPILKRSGMIKYPDSGLTAEGEEHRRTRKLVRTSFGTRALNGYGEIMVEQAMRAQAGWRDGESIDLDAAAQELALNIATNTFFGADMRVEPRIINDVLKAIEWSMVLTMLPFGELARRLPLPGNRHRARAVRALDEALHQVIANARNTGDARADLLSLLVNATDEDGIYDPFNEAELRDLCFILLFAGHETTATAITWCLYHHRRNPETRKRLEKELEEVLGGRPPTPADYRNLVYTRAVLDENLRLTPPIYIVGRSALEDCTLGGDHICVGSGFGKMAVVLTLATLCQRWHLDVISPEFPELNTTALFRLKNGLPVKLSARKS